jgi:glutamate dehydrogenase
VPGLPPRDRFHTQIRERIQEILREELDGESVDFELRLSESVLVRIHFVVRLPAGTRPQGDLAAIERRIAAATRTWADDLHDLLVEDAGEESGVALSRRYRNAFPAGYREHWPARAAVADVRALEALAGDDLALRLYRPPRRPRGRCAARSSPARERVTLSDVLPMFESMGLGVADERPYRVAPRGGTPAWIYDFGLLAPDGEVDLSAVRARFEDGLARIWRREADEDGFNGLILRGGLDWREVSVLRAIGRYLRQAGINFSLRYIEQALLAQPPDRRAPRRALPRAAGPGAA